MSKDKKRIGLKIFCGIGLAVLCIGIGILIGKGNLFQSQETVSCYAEESTEIDISARKDANEETYEKIYQHMKEHQPDYIRDNSLIREDIAADAAEEEASPEEPMNEIPAEEEAPAMDGASEDFAGTNLQVEFVDEGDIVKNDGRYLYQLLREDDYGHVSIQIVDTKDKLQEVSRISDFSNIQEFYIWEDSLVVIERLWAESISEEELRVYDGMYGGNPFSKLRFYDISDRKNPKEIYSYTLRGEYKTSRVADGFLYYFSNYYINTPAEKDNLKSYIPIVNGEVLEYDSLYLPEITSATSYLLMVSIDLSNPAEFTDKMAVVSDGNDYYVSNHNIYILEAIWADYEQDGIQCDKTQIVRFAYENGQIELGVEGVVDGLLLDQFAMNEYNDYFRIITTVSAMRVEKITDDFSGEVIGYAIAEEMPVTNSVYVLDTELNVVGSLTGLAEEERVYSARFMGDTGYFVTFKQVDPLFSVDFSEPTQPKILGELKITGFSEYLHFYGEDRLVGIGYETDPETGIIKGLKLSMFDVSDPVDVKETEKLVLEKYDHADAFYNHHAVLVSESKNIIGFLSEGYWEHHMRDYGVYSYEEGSGFIQRFMVDCIPDEYEYFEVRGTYIGDTFYILQQNGGVQAFDIQTGEFIDSLEIE